MHRSYKLRVQCFRVSIQPAVSPTLWRQMDMGSLTFLGACRTHEEGSGTNKSVQRVDSVREKREKKGSLIYVTMTPEDIKRDDDGSQ